MNKKIGCLILHGFAGNLEEVNPLNKYLLKKGYMAMCPIANWHITSRRNLFSSKYNEWIKSAEEFFQEIYSKCKNVVILGFSMGGLIAVNLAMKYKIEGLVMISTPIYYWNLKRIVRNILNDIKSGDYKNIKRYISATVHTPLSALINFKILLLKTKPLLKKIKYPVFIAQGMLDDVVHYKSADYIYRNVSSEVKYIKYYKNSDHLICQGPDNNILFNHIENFISILHKAYA